MKQSKRAHRVIFADDDPDILSMLAVMGEMQGWIVETATTAEDLLAKVNDQCSNQGDCFDIVVTDVSFFNEGMPGISGIAVGRQLERAFPNLPILFVTGYGGLLTRENIKAISTAEYIEKPVDPHRLVERIERLILFTAKYRGPERRRTSVNRSGFVRRSTDAAIGIPKVLQAVMDASH